MRPFASWREIAEFIVFIGVSVAGIFSASWLWVVTGAMTLFLLGFSRWRTNLERTGSVDADCRELAQLAFAARLFGVGFDMYAKAHNVLLVLTTKFGLDTLFLAGAYCFSRVAGWFLGIDADVFSIEQS